MKPNFILISISYFYLVHAFWLGVGAYTAWLDTRASAMNSFGFPIITGSCLFAIMAITTAVAGVSLRLVKRWACFLAVALSSLALVIIAGLVILGILSRADLISLLVPLLGFGCHSAILWFLKANSLALGFGLIRWRRIVVPSLCGIMTMAWLFFAIVHITVEGRRSLYIVLKPYPTFWSIHSYKIDRLPRDEEGFVMKPNEKIWYRNWNYLLSYQLPLL